MKKKVFIIAEAGVNHNGDIKNAFKLIDRAKEAEADAIKFQTFKAEKVMSKFAQKAEYQKNNTGSDETQLEMVKKLELTNKEFVMIKNYCQKVGILFLSTPFDLDSIDFLDSISMKQWKIPSGEITNLPFLIKIAKLKKPVILSTGMSNLIEIEKAVDILKINGCKHLTILHCTTEYPAPFEEINLKAMLTIKNKFDVDVGYSDHTTGIEVPIAAVAMGATIIEKHFTLDKSMDGPDHKASLEPKELKLMVKSIRNIEVALGDGIKKISNSEKKNLIIARKSIIAKKKIKKGEILTTNNLTIKRPGNGINPMKWFEVLGTYASRNFEEDEIIEL
jgi:N,N'-diacetyllegionaminate synthase